MGREVRMVPKDWQHPQESGRYVPLWPSDSYAPRAANFIEILNNHGLQEALEQCGAPNKNDYMPDWPQAERTHYMMYEDASEGTPISPAFSTPEELAKWLHETGASYFGKATASYDSWLAVCRGRWVPSLIIIMSGVEYAERAANG
jgi:hypothetical protein